MINFFSKKDIESKSESKKGFTLIELLITVSIIAFLASIVVAGLTDARAGARNSQRNELARQYINALGLYFSEYGDFPDNGANAVCLGAGYPSNNCSLVSGITRSESATVNSAISEFMPGLPASLEQVRISGGAVYGILYECSDVQCKSYSITWLLEGGGNDANCFAGAGYVDYGPGVYKACTFYSNN